MENTTGLKPIICLWAVKAGNYTWQEDLIKTFVDSTELGQKLPIIKGWAEKSGFSKFRISIDDPRQPLKFGKNLLARKN